MDRVNELAPSAFKMTAWIPWEGGECPVPGWVKVHFRTVSEMQNKGWHISEADDGREASTLRWEWHDKREPMLNDNIAMYRIVFPA